MLKTMAVIAALLALTACGGSSLTGTTVTDSKPTPVQIARANNLTGFRSCDVSTTLFTNGSGIGYRGSVKYAINTFATIQGRDSWLQVAKDFGFPSTYQQGDTWVMYRATDQSGGCSQS